MSVSGLYETLYSMHCEMGFSELKIAKIRFRSTLTADLFSDLILMDVERDLFVYLNKNLIIN